MRYLGIDYGLKRIGLAISDPEGKIAFPFKTVSRLRDIVAVIKKNRVGSIVIGLPVAGHSQVWQKQAEEIRRFADLLKKKVQLPIEFENEAFTTKIAERSSPKEKVDASAAALILQSYLDKLWSKSEAGNPQSIHSYH